MADATVIALGALLAACLCALVALAALLVWRRRARTVLVTRPAPVAGVEQDGGWSGLRLEERIGGGATALVYRAHHNDQPVAVKRLRPGALHRQVTSLFQEIRALREVRHKNVVGLVAAVTAADPVGVVLDLCDGGTLADRQDADAAQRAAWCLQALRGLAVVHAARWAHCDVAGRNFLLTADRSTVRLADFGGARPCGPGDRYREPDAVHVAARWAAPETLRRGVFSHATDAWSMGMTLVEVYSGGTRPFGDVEEGEVYRRLLRGIRPAVPAAAPQRLRTALVERLSRASAEGLVLEVWRAALA